MFNLFIGGIGACSLAAHLALEEAGADYKVTRLDLAKGDQKTADYLKINPKARVPALVTDKGIITENPAILMYIAQTHPKAGLAPLADPFAVAQIQAFNSYLCSTMHPHHAHAIRGARWSDDPAVIEGLKAKVPQNMSDCCAYIEQDYLKSGWVLGNTFSIADIYLYTIATWLEGDKVDVSRFPKIAAHRARVAERPSVKKVRSSYA